MATVQQQSLLKEQERTGMFSFLEACIFSRVTHGAMSKHSGYILSHFLLMLFSTAAGV